MFEELKRDLKLTFSEMGIDIVLCGVIGAAVMWLFIAALIALLG